MPRDSRYDLKCTERLSAHSRSACVQAGGENQVRASISNLEIQVRASISKSPLHMRGVESKRTDIH